MHSIKQKNITNLTSLWQLVGDAFQCYFSQNNINYCYIPDSEWPNRIWFDKEVTSEMLVTATEIARNSPVAMTLSHSSHFENKISTIFENFGFQKKSEQIGMSLKLPQKFNFTNNIFLEKVTNEKQATIWSELYPQSFGYKISTTTVIATCHIISYYLIHFDHQIVGTVITHQSEDVIGIHGLGIVPEFRKQGLAEETMIALLNKASDENIEFATLQSSQMGKNIYLKIGFSEDFLMTNYKLTNAI